MFFLIILFFYVLVIELMLNNLLILNNVYVVLVEFEFELSVVNFFVVEECILVEFCLVFGVVEMMVEDDFFDFGGYFLIVM